MTLERNLNIAIIQSILHSRENPVKRAFVVKFPLWAHSRNNLDPDKNEAENIHCLFIYLCLSLSSHPSSPLAVDYN